MNNSEIFESTESSLIIKQSNVQIHDSYFYKNSGQTGGCLSV